jgi:hypothetical protein
MEEWELHRLTEVLEEQTRLLRGLMEEQVALLHRIVHLLELQTPEAPSYQRPSQILVKQ